MSELQQQGLQAFMRQDYPQALQHFTRLLAVSHANLAATHDAMGAPAAEAHYRAALEAWPDNADMAVGLAIWLLREGRYAEAWPLYEQRRAIASRRLPPIPAHWPEWRGEPLAGRRLAVIGEQGLGDQIMWARFLEPVRAAGGEPILCCDPALARLLGGAASVERAGFDLWCYQQSLPGLLGVTLETLPPPVALPVRWRGGGGIGLVPTGSASHADDARRSLPPALEAELLQLGQDLRPQATGARDFQDTAEIVAGLDLVITVDTSVAHLAGSMGAPTWVLLPTPLTDWRWMSGRDDSPWYPSVRLFRQAASGDWAGVLRQVQGALAARG